MTLKTSLLIRSFFATLTFTLLANFCFGQSNFQPRNVTPASPDVANFAKYGSYEVSYFTGLPDISIPLYTITQNDLSVPIVLRYHASGIKVTDDAGWVGLGWSLDAGGQISRQVMGNKADEASGGYLTYGKPSAEADLFTVAGLQTLWDVHKGIKDREPDIFSYAMPGKNGKFFFQQSNGYAPTTIPYDPIKIDFTGGHFSIVSETGTKYTFNDAEQTQTNSSTESVNSAWMLNEIRSANDKDIITFNYTSRYGVTYHEETEHISVTDKVDGPGPPEISAPVISVQHVMTTEYKLDNILFNNGQIKFEVADRTDGFAGQKKLTRMLVKAFDPNTNTYSTDKIIAFIQSEFMRNQDAETKRMRLDRVEIQDPSGVPIEVYKFDYDLSVSLPAKNSRARDQWGYYNGQDANTTLMPKMKIDFQSTVTSGLDWIEIGSANRDPNPNYGHAWMLKRIYYPTQGYTDFAYEPNRYMDHDPVLNADVAKVGAGFRVKAIKSYNGIDDSPTTRTFKYGVDESGYGVKNFFESQYFYSTSVNERFIAPVQDHCDAIVERHRSRVFYSVPQIEVSPLDGASTFYPVVTEYVGSLSYNAGKTTFVYTDFTDNLQTSMMVNKAVLLSNHFKRGLLKEKQVYKNENGIYKLVTKTVNDYFATPEVSYTAGFAVLKTLISFGQLTGDEIQCSPYDPLNGCNAINDSYSYLQSFYDIKIGDNRLIQTTEYVYDQQDQNKFTTNLTTYSYSNLMHFQPTAVQTTGSDGRTRKTITRYTADFSTAPYNTMRADPKHIVALPVEVETQINGATMTLQKRQFTDFGQAGFLPEFVYSQVQTNPQRLELTYVYDAEGRIKQYVAKDGVVNAVIWGSSRTTPLAVVTGAPVSQVAFNSFEDNSGVGANTDGGWTLGASPVAATAKTGNYIYRGSLSNTSLSNQYSSVVEVWINGTNSLVVSGSGGTATGVLMKSQGTWNLYSYDLGNTTSVTISNPNGIDLDDVRLFPRGSDMKSFFTQPLIGLKAATDVNQNSASYEYDEIGRLARTRDNDKNIVRQHAYQFKSSPDFVATLPYEYYNNQATYSFAKQCPTGYRGSMVGYAVAAAKYVSSVSQYDADNQAYAEAAQNGPTKANNEGTCTQIVYVDVIAVNGRGDSGYKVRFLPKNGQPQIIRDLPAGFDADVTITVEAGTYDISIYNPSSNPPPQNRNFTIFGTVFENVKSATKTNVVVSPTSNNAMRLHSTP